MASKRGCLTISEVVSALGKEKQQGIDKSSDDNFEPTSLENLDPCFKDSVSINETIQEESSSSDDEPDPEPSTSSKKKSTRKHAKATQQKPACKRKKTTQVCESPFKWSPMTESLHNKNADAPFLENCGPTRRDSTKRPAKEDTEYKLYQVNPLISALTQTFATLYVPSRNVSIDEMLLGRKCRVSFTPYMPKKPKKFGIKIWALCEAETGYCCSFQVYTGKADSNQAELGLSYRVVFDLLKNYLDKGYRLFISNFYTSVQLIFDLVQRNTFVCGTLQANRKKLPPQLKEKIAVDEIKFWNCGNLVCAH
ncbi:Hypothetical predicted protein [Paramuricea clavata]|uniref:PiggyBac transposable element-derived protein domain-containing protein n=1 Tax=Paramuricea clavata TaxID=317549 RepID=A0A7D9DH29_PARCT|nr:Hypothetical predicted protein [Paramuricea clavata]